jgi:acetylornithine deacetylase
MDNMKVIHKIKNGLMYGATDYSSKRVSGIITFEQNGNRGMKMHSMNSRTNTPLPGHNADDYMPLLDAKGNVVLMIHAFLNSYGSLLVISPDEETESNGIYNFCQYLKNKNKSKNIRCIVGEPTDLKVCVGHKGRFEYIVEGFGEARHASSQGINPIEILSEVILDLKQMPLKKIEIDKIYSSSITPTIIKGGIQSNIIPDYAYVLFDVRSVEKDIIKKINYLLSQKPYSRYIKSHLNPERHYADFYMLENKGLIDELSKEFEISFFNATCEAYYFNKFLNAEAVIYGVGKLELAHSKNEYLNLKDFDKGIEGIEKLANIMADNV